MRLAATALVVTLLAVVPASGQTAAPAPPEHPYGLDPYDPSDAALLRDYGRHAGGADASGGAPQAGPVQAKSRRLASPAGWGHPALGLGVVRTWSHAADTISATRGDVARAWPPKGPAAEAVASARRRTCARCCCATASHVHRDVAHAGNQRRRLDTLCGAEVDQRRPSSPAQRLGVPARWPVRGVPGLQADTGERRCDLRPDAQGIGDAVSAEALAAMLLQSGGARPTRRTRSRNCGSPVSGCQAWSTVMLVSQLSRTSIRPLEPLQSEAFSPRPT